MTLKQLCFYSLIIVSSPSLLLAGETNTTTKSWSFASCPVNSYSVLEYSPPPLFSNDAANTTDISAEQVQNMNKSTSTFSGDVLIERHKLRLQTDQAIHNTDTQTLDLLGNVHIDTEHMALTAKSGWLNIQTNEGEFIDSAYYMPETHFSGTTPVFSFSKNNVTTLIDTQFSTCPTNKLDWHLNTSWLELDQETKTGTAKHTVFWLKSVPIFYFPWIQFPLGEERRSGFLIPSIGSSSSNGLEVSTPWYWNIAPNHDATITPTYLRKRGALLGTDYRYITHSSKGELNLDFINEDKITNEQRYLLNFKNSSKLTDQLNFSLLYNDASDPDYLQDLGGNIAITNITHLERTAKFNFIEGPWNASLMAQDFQTIDESISLGNRPYQRLPQITLKGEDELLDMDNSYLVGTLTSEWVEFQHEDPTKEQGSRFYIYPKLSLPIEGNSWFIKPSAGYAFTQYDTTDSNGDELDLDNRGLSIISLDSGLFFERNVSSSNFLQTIEPRLFYLNVPYEDQSNIPIFDTAETDFSFASLFRETRFNGIDRIGDANQLTIGLSSRILNKQTGNEVFNFSVGQIKYFDDQRVSINNNINTSRNSDIITEIGGRLNKWKARVTLQWNTETDKTDKRSVQLNYAASNDAVFNIGYRFYRDPNDEDLNLEQSDISFAWPFASRYALLSRWNYSLTDEKDIETIFGIEYESCCYALRLISQRYIKNNNDTDDDEYQSSILFQFVLKGFGSISDREATETLKQAILGYQPDH